MSDRVEAAARALREWWGNGFAEDWSVPARAALAAADEAEPMVPASEAKDWAWAWVGSQIEEAQARADRAERAARELAEALHRIVRGPSRRYTGSYDNGREVLARFPEYSKDRS